MRRMVRGIVLGALLLAPLTAWAAEESAAVKSALASITAEESLGHIKVLASDDLKGRLAGSPEGRRAAEYVAEQFRKAGLKGVAPDGGFLQPFTRSRTGTDAKSTLTVTVGKKAMALKGRKDFVAFPFSGRGKATAEVVWVGYGITAPEEHYDDYAGLDVKGKVVLVMRHEPARGVEGKAFAGKQDTKHSHFAIKALTAQTHGAAAMLFFSDHASHGKEPDFLFADRAPGDEKITIPVVQIKRKTATALLAAAGKDVAAIQREIDRTIKPQSFVIPGSEAAIDLRITKIAKRLQNVVGVLPGSDESVADQYVIVGAHYDHIGTGQYGARRGRGQVFNGADDNASGTAAVLEVAQALGTHHLKLRRSVLFIAFDGEEAGLLGSRHYVQHPLVPLEKTVAMINLDMVGRARKGEAVVMGVDSAKPFRPMMTRLAESEGVGLSLRMGGSVGASDHAVFYQRNLPVLFFFGTMHKDYHTPADDWDKINSDGVGRIARLVMLATREIANLEDRLAFVPPKPASKQPFLGVSGSPGEGDAVVIGTVVPGSAAARAGLKVSDVILKADGKPVTSWRAFVSIIAARKPGDTLTLTVRRDDAERSLTVTLGSRADMRRTR